MTSFAHLPVGSVDVLPSVAAVNWPDRAALRTASGTVTFAELDLAVSRLAFGLRQQLGGDGLTVAVSALPGTHFPAAFYAIIRSGNVAAPVDPDTPAEVFADFLAVTRTRAVILDRAMYERVCAVLPETLELVLLLDAPAGPGVPTCAELAAGGSLLVEPRDRDEHEPAVILSGLLTHHELKVRASAVARNAVVLTTMSAYDPVAMSAALLTGATQVLSGGEETPTRVPAEPGLQAA
jgi:acyl-CoA synthetase (AMP-forming)/AMP-acid ligase II